MPNSSIFGERWAASASSAVTSEEALKILVTGAAGFICGYLVPELLEAGHDVVGIDDFSKYGPLAKSYDGHPRYRFVRGDDLVAVGSELTEQCHDLGGAADETLARVAVVALGERAVLAEVVDADHVMTGLEELRDKVPADEPGGSGDKDLQSRIPPPIAPQMSTTSRPPIASPR